MKTEFSMNELFFMSSNKFDEKYFWSRYKVVNQEGSHDSVEKYATKMYGK